METRIVPIGGKLYTITEYGDVYKIRGKGFKVPFPDKKGYLRLMVPFKFGGPYDNQFVHRLVYKAFHGEIPPDMTVDHIDSDRLNNHYSNLQLLSQTDNAIKGNAKNWSFLSPDGTLFEIYNLEAFCKDHNLHPGHMRYVHRGKPSHYQHKGWTKYVKTSDC
ncbi:MAG: HNH endonuclease signature motif containing protein [Bacteroidales bacterium]